MAKKEGKKVIKDRCRDCVYCQLDKSNLSFATKEPFMGYCINQEYKFLINHNYCDKFANKKPIN